MTKILLIEDEDSLATGLIDVLTIQGYEVKRESRGDVGLKRALTEFFDLIVLDVELPGISGFELLRAFREENSESRVIMLSARQTEVDRVLGFELGTDDYLTKPFSLAELLGRVKALLRRSVKATASSSTPPRVEKVQFGATSVDFERFQVLRDQTELKLPSKAFDLLRTLVDKKGQVVSRDELIDTTWSDEECITLRTLNNLVVKIRQVIEHKPDEPVFLKTVHGVGYKLIVPS